MLLVLRDSPGHGYELLEQLQTLMPAERIDMGNLYRILRSLEREGLVASTWHEEAPGPAKRIYVITPSGQPRPRPVGRGLREDRAADRRLYRALHRGEGVTHASRTQTIPPRRGVGHRFYEPERVLERLEEYQRDLEQEIADVADLIEQAQEERARSESRSRKTAARGGSLELSPLRAAFSDLRFLALLLRSPRSASRATWLGTSS